MAIIHIITGLIGILGNGLVYYILYLQLCYNIKKAMKQLDMNEKKSELVLKNTHQLIENVKLTSKFLSPYCIVIILILLFSLIFSIYNIFAIHLNPINTIKMALIWMILVSLFVGSLFSLWVLNSQSEDIKQGLKNIKDKIQYLVISDDGFIEIKGNILSEAYARRLIISLLDEFKGFEVFGYATLGKPYQSTLLVLVVSYVAIMMKLHLSFPTCPN